MGKEFNVAQLLDGRRVLVTGANGFVGSRLTEALLDYGANVHVLVQRYFVRAADQHWAPEAGGCHPQGFPWTSNSYGGLTFH